MEIADSLRSSLLLIKVDGLRLRVSQPGLEQGRPKRDLDGLFRYRSTDYTLRVTDPDYEKDYKPQGNGHVYCRGGIPHGKLG